MLGIGAAQGATVGAAVDNHGRFSLFAAIQHGAGIGVSAGVSAGLQNGSAHTIAGGSLSGPISQNATTLTVSAGPVSAGATAPGRGQEGVGAGVSGASPRWGVGAGVFVTQQQTIATPPTAPVVDPLVDKAKQFMNDATRLMNCPFGCQP